MARSDKVAMCVVRYMIPLIFAVEFIAIAALAWSLGGPQWAFGAVAAVALMLVLLCVLLHGRSLGRVRPRRFGREVMPMAPKGLHRKRDHKGRKPMSGEVELTIAVASAVPMAAIIALALGCYIGLSVSGVLAVTFLFTALLTIYAVTVRALCLEYRKSGLAD